MAAVTGGCPTIAGAWRERKWKTYSWYPQVKVKDQVSASGDISETVTTQILNSDKNGGWNLSLFKVWFL